MSKQVYLLLAHIIIFIISIFGLIHLHSFEGNDIIEIITAIFHFLLVLSFYLVSGYLITRKTEKFQLKQYWIITFIGICIWLAAFINSPTDLNWKKGNDGILWFLYRIYVVPTELPFCFSDYFKTHQLNTVIRHVFLISFSIIPSVMQAIGGFLKTQTVSQESKL
ncbi:hypothetical protein U8527_04675 [Kordia algicida OT-1]|uniref:Uncharacterized protein n=1 Tax=Kordia algicida OT-1 TaxID=391587 RepID=A9DM29_9FLAO|nr:hypothetical protein [Kordia algicida]EDP97618.1 hypothetical protein KAOT1_20687 [Kordia algicida OT-1]